MLANQIKQIRKEKKEYRSNLWDFRFAGDTLELTVKSNYALASEMYRMGVIAVGKVLRAINHIAFEKGFTTQVHSFPSLHESQLIASVRLHKKYGSSSTVSLEGINRISINEDSEVKLLKALASHYSLFFNTSSGSGFDSDTPDSVHDPEYDNKKSNLFSVCSSMDNPFIWLKVGQWLEGVKLLKLHHPSFKMPVIKTDIKSPKRASLGSKFDNCSYSQAIVALENSSLINDIQYLFDD